MLADIAYGLGRIPSVGRAIGAGRQFAAAPGAGTAWTLAGNVVGVIGPDKLINALIRYGEGIATRSGALDEAAARDIVRLAQERAPTRTGTLREGIEAFPSGGGWTVRSAAQRYANSADYARFVELGTAAGERGGRRVAGDDYYAAPFSGRRGSLNEATGRRRRAHDARRLVARTHPGTEARPYFLPSVREVMERRGADMEEVSDTIASQVGLI